MNFTFNEAQLDFRNAVRALFMSEIDADLIRRLWNTDTGRSEDVWKLLATQGLLALSTPTQCGGLSFADTYWMRIGEEVGYFALPEPLMDTAYLGVMILRSLPESPLIIDLMLKISEGLCKFAIQHPINKLTADAHVADYILAWDQDDLHLLSRGAFQYRRVTSMDPSRRAFTLTWKPSDDTLLAKNVPDIQQNLLNRGSFAIACQLSGLTKRLMDLAIDFSVNRKQFGKPIGSFQAVKHLLADVAVQLEYVRPIIMRAAHSLETNHPDCQWHVSHAKWMVSETAQLAARRSIQVHGAMGYTWEVDVQIFAKRVWSLVTTWGEIPYHQKKCEEAITNRPIEQLLPGSTF